MRIEIKKRFFTLHVNPDKPYYIMKRTEHNKDDKDFFHCYDSTMNHTYDFISVLYLQKDFKWYANCEKENFFGRYEAVSFVFEYIKRSHKDNYGIEIEIDGKLLGLPNIDFIAENEMII